MKQPIATAAADDDASLLSRFLEYPLNHARLVLRTTAVLTLLLALATAVSSI